jgi:hypothetical protein
VTVAQLGPATLFLVVFMVIGAGCRGGGEAATEPRPAVERQGSVVALLLDNTLMRIGVSEGAASSELNLGAAPNRLEPGRYLALGKGAQLFVLVRRSGGHADEIAVVDPRTLAVGARYPLEEDAIYRGIVLASSGVLYAYGNEPGRLLDEASGAYEEDAVVTALDTTDGSFTTTTVRRARGRDWWTYWGTLSSDETTLILAYHGGCGPGYFRACTTGADKLDVSAGNVALCRTRSRAYSGCLGGVHGAVAAHGDGFVASTGSPKVLELDERGRRIGSLRTRLNTHLMQIAVGASRLYAIGSCALGGGLSATDFATGSVVVWAYLCGERLSAGPDGLLALAANSQPVPIGTPSRLLVIDGSSGREVRAVRTPLEVLDLSFVPGDQ